MIDPIVVLSSPRSGSSMVCGCLAVHGVFVGKDKPADDINPKGYFENLQLSALRFRDQLTPENVLMVLARDGYEGGPWMHKHTPRYWAKWRRFNPVWVFVRRDPAAIANSRMASNGHFDDPDLATGRAVAVADQNVMDDVRERFGGFDVRSERIIEGDYSDLEPVLAAVNLPLLPKLLDKWVEPTLWHH